MHPILLALLLPFAGTTLGSACVYLTKENMPAALQKALLGCAAGVMVAASVWSLLIPAMELSGGEGLAGVMPAAAGFAFGIAFLLLLDHITPHQHLLEKASEGPRSKLSRTTKLALAVTLHNIPEGMAVGVTLAAALDAAGGISMAAALALSAGIAIQNFPEGAIVSMPLRAAGNTHHRSFAIGALSGAVEPVAAIVTLLLASFVVPVLPYLLAFSAGAMLYVVVEEIIPETQQGRHSDIGTIGFAAGFVLMMVLDVVLG